MPRGNEEKKSFIYVILLVSVATILTFGLMMYWRQAPSEIYNLCMAAISLALSLVALIYAMITYYSIDRVQSINSMDGNILKEENYSIAYREQIERFAKDTTPEAFSRHLLERVNYRKVTTCNELAKELQEIVDYMVWFAYMEDNAENRNQLKSICERLKDDITEMGKVNNGIQVLLEEHLKLIMYVFEYQNTRKKEENIELGGLENVRGKILLNPVTQIVYYDYLGLEYLSRSRNVIIGYLPQSQERAFWEHDNLEAIRAFFRNGTPESDVAREKTMLLLWRALDAFDTADRLAKNDLFWNGFISFNVIRARILMELVCGEEDAREVKKGLDAVVKTRHDLVYLIWNVWLDENGHAMEEETDIPYLRRRLTEEYMLARRLQDNYRLTIGGVDNNL